MAAGGLVLSLLLWQAVSGSGDRKPDSLRQADLSREGSSLVIRVETRKPVALEKLNPFPDQGSGDGPFLCLNLVPGAEDPGTRICFGGRERPRGELGVTRIEPDGSVISRKRVQADIERDGETGLVATLPPDWTGLVPGYYDWQAVMAEPGCAGENCVDSYPAGEDREEFAVKPVLATGCTAGTGKVVRSGPRDSKRVALTFDDGPGPYTEAVIQTLDRHQVKATFFMAGREVRKHPQLARKVLWHGHEPANHSTSHAENPSEEDVLTTSLMVKNAVGFEPCLFRPPYGSLSKRLKAVAGRAGMEVILWDVDSVDWGGLSSAAITEAIVRDVRPGSIVLMHDGGDSRAQTVDSLDGTIRELKRQGYSLVTVTELLGNRFRFSPEK